VYEQYVKGNISSDKCIASVARLIPWSLQVQTQVTLASQVLMSEVTRVHVDSVFLQSGQWRCHCSSAHIVAAIM